MKRTLFVILFLLALFPFSVSASDLVHHDITVTLHPDEHRLTATDAITLPKDFAREIIFTLHAGLKPSSPSPAVRIIKQADIPGDLPLEQFKAIVPPGLHAFTISYEGSIHHPIDRSSEQMNGTRNTPGLISADGVYLSASSHWYPEFGPGLMTFDLEVRLPAAWDVVSQGERMAHDRGGSLTFVRWSSPEPQDEIFLIAAQFTVYTRHSAGITAMAFLRTPDEDLATRYLDATVRYITMYSSLIGPYPYKKFALVENFWETGFGMPSFTLLGPTVVRLPFIIDTSYPHEVLHNWWGNSVYPDYMTGNWSEGLTAYLADHLMKEQQNAGAEYRMNTLQKYADYVREGRDFPLTAFRSRHSSSSEAIGYGKALMFFHMLRRELGDETFVLGLRDFYQKNKYRTASFDDLAASFSAISGKNLSDRFAQWVTRTGAPQLRISHPAVIADKDGFLLSAMLEQTQPEDAYVLQVPVAVTLEGQEQAFQSVVEMTGRRTEMKLRVTSRPLRLDIDPEFDLFRRLDRGEIPPAISQALGAKKMLVLLPSSAGKKLLDAYRGFSRTLAQSGPDDVEVKLDSEISQLSADRAIVVLGWENRFFKTMPTLFAGYDVALSKQSARIEGTGIAAPGHSFVLTARHPKNPDLALMFIATDLPGALTGLGRKLPHYHKYSYLAFEGPEPANIAKGRWQVNDSPMTIFIPSAAGKIKKVVRGKLVQREPLAKP